jgi:putative ATPase
VEEGIITLFGATTENPKFSVNSTILSRCIVIETKPLTKKESVELISKVAKHYSQKITFDPPEALNTLLNRSNGDARKLITVLEACIEVLQCNQITNEVLDAIIPTKHLVFDSTGQDHFDIAHCYQEAIQNSDVDSAIYWLAKWLESGEEPAYICRRMLITAFEDCYSNPEAASLAMAATFATERTGMHDTNGSSHMYDGNKPQRQNSVLCHKRGNQ